MPGGGVDYFNARWYAWTGRPVPERPEEPWEDVLHPDDLERWRASWRRALRTGEGRDVECRFRDGSGYRWFLARVRPVRDAGGVVVRWFGTFTEIDGIVRAREAYRDRSAELSEADRRKDDFLAILGHELRNPLGALANNLRLLQARVPENDDLLCLTDVMDRQVRRMTHLLDDLLDLARIQHGKLRLKRCPVVLGCAVQRAVESVTPLIERRAHRLEVAVERGLCVDADATRLAQILENLMSNAARYTDPGGTISVRAVADGAMARVSVSDDGRGLSERELSRVFEPFNQIREEGTACEGLGIGLTIVRQLVELHGGQIHAHSEGLGHGAQFEFTVPLGEGCPAEPHRPTLVADTAARGRLLLVDDNVDGANGLASLLTLHGYHVEVVHDGTSAREAVVRRRPDVLLVDVGLPDANGVTLASALREEGRLDGTRVIALTGFGDDRIRRRVVRSGFVGCLLKPIDFDELLQLLTATEDSASLT